MKDLNANKLLVMTLSVSVSLALTAYQNPSRFAVSRLFRAACVMPENGYFSGALTKYAEMSRSRYSFEP